MIHRGICIPNMVISSMLESKKSMINIDHINACIVVYFRRSQKLDNF